MADAPPPNLRPMRPIKRVPFVEEMMPLLGPALADPNDQARAAAPAASAAPAATPSFVTSPTAAPSLTSKLASAVSGAAALASAIPGASAVAAAVPGVAAFAAAPSAASALGAITPALGRVSPALSEIASAAPAVEALIEKPSLTTALGAAAPALSAAAPNVAQYANPLLQKVVYQDPMLAIADRVAGIGQSHPAEDAAGHEILKNLATNMLTKKGIEAVINKVVTGALALEGGPPALIAGAIVDALKIKPAY